MERRRIGRSGLRVTTVGLGCNNFGWTIGQDASNEVVAKALDLGINLFDTADRYGATGGDSEVVLGKALGARRKDIVLLTKFGVDLINARIRDSSRHYIMRAVEASLKRLGTDYIDCYMIHWPDYGTPMDETLRALDDLVRSGKLRYIACSNLETWRVADAVWISKHQGLETFIATQTEYNLLNRSAEKDVIPALQHYGLGFIPYYPLASGLLTGKYSAPGAQGRLKDNFLRLGDTFMTERNLKLVKALDAYCRERGHTLLELAVSWLAAQPGVASVICGATQVEQVEQNVKAASWALSAEELAEVDKLTKAG
ncbi:MAG: putative oxidoreductase [Hydrocarboniphaga sp.]|uniref:aldo/keto reductase n=1 Tax=Hydrocarboniphaga sp. TaxID=2033016 RepID=UPI00263179DB|nr:aldo/keto reductase [Hydrocarboniphaga sp.]MDB5968691.1 putative oxidoreductase [Hydrocarboniphaga sp.]